MIRDEHSARLPKFVAGTLMLGLLMGVSFGCGQGQEADSQAQSKPPRRPPTLVRARPVISHEISPEVTVVGTVVAKKRSVVASGANGVVEHYLVDEGQFVNKDDILSVLRMETSNRELDEARSILSERKAIWDESKSFRSEEIAEARFKMIATQKTRDSAKDHFNRIKSAFMKDAVNKDQYEEAMERYDVAEALYLAASEAYQRLRKGPRKEKQEQARFRYLAQQERVKFLEAEQKKRTTKAPFSGYVVKEHSYIGQWLSKGDSVATLAMLDEVDVVVNVDQKDLPHIQIGKMADVKIPGYDLTAITTKSNDSLSGLIVLETPDEIHLEREDGSIQKIAKSEILTRGPKPWTGRILQIVPQSEWQTGSRAFPVKVRIRNHFRNVSVPAETKNSAGRKSSSPKMVKRRLPVLNEGMMATVTFRGRKVKTRLVPKDALVRTTHGFRINLFRPGKPGSNLGSTIQLTVRTGMSVGDHIQVSVQPKNPGDPADLTDGMLVVTEGGERLLPVQGNVQIRLGDTSGLKTTK
ncbi:MAG: hypothetical protein Tsb009_14050 [Planctomycetaceae bacterium]